MNNPDIVTLAREVLVLASKATEGPWEQDKYGLNLLAVTPDGSHPASPLTSTVWDTEQRIVNMRFVAHTRTSAPELAQAVLDQAQRIAVLERALAMLCGGVYEVPLGLVLSMDFCDVCDEKPQCRAEWPCQHDDKCSTALAYAIAEAELAEQQPQCPGKSCDWWTSDGSGCKGFLGDCPHIQERELATEKGGEQE